MISCRINGVALCSYTVNAEEGIDYEVLSNLVRLHFLHDPVAVEVEFINDGIALESNEIATLELTAPVPVPARNEGVFFRRTIYLHIVDSDGKCGNYNCMSSVFSFSLILSIHLVLDIFLDQETYEFPESSYGVFVVCKNVPIAESVTVIASALTIENASIMLPYIPEYNPHSPNRAS